MRIIVVLIKIFISIFRVIASFVPLVLVVGYIVVVALDGTVLRPLVILVVNIQL